MKFFICVSFWGYCERGKAGLGRGGGYGKEGLRRGPGMRGGGVRTYGQGGISVSFDLLSYF